MQGKKKGADAKRQPVKPLCFDPMQQQQPELQLAGLQEQELRRRQRLTLELHVHSPPYVPDASSRTACHTAARNRPQYMEVLKVVVVILPEQKTDRRLQDV